MKNNPLRDIFEKNEGNALIYKWLHYFDIYHRHFAKYIGQSPIILEIGVYHGGSLQMWKEYFGVGCQIIGIDINPNCKELESDDVTIYTGSQEDRDFLGQVVNDVGPVDILIDDGGHTMQQQRITFEQLYANVKTPGVYLVEDLHTSYWRDWGGGLDNPNSFIEYSKKLIDQLNAWHYGKQPGDDQSDRSLVVNEFTRNTYSMNYYDSVLVLEKAMINEPSAKRIGKEQIEENLAKDNVQSTSS